MQTHGEFWWRPPYRLFFVQGVKADVNLFAYYGYRVTPKSSALKTKTAFLR